MIREIVGHWFRPKRVGVGWRPATWQGWLAACAPGVVVLAIVFARH